MDFIELPVTKRTSIPKIVLLTHWFIDREEILKLYDEHQVLLIAGETGSGKTTRT